MATYPLDGTIVKLGNRWIVRTISGYQPFNYRIDAERYARAYMSGRIGKAAARAEHVLHLFENKHPNDDRPRKAIQAARDFANGMIDADEMAAARKAAWAAFDDAPIQGLRRLLLRLLALQVHLDAAAAAAAAAEHEWQTARLTYPQTPFNRDSLHI